MSEPSQEFEPTINQPPWPSGVYSTAATVRPSRITRTNSLPVASGTRVLDDVVGREAPELRPGRCRRRHGRSGRTLGVIRGAAGARPARRVRRAPRRWRRVQLVRIDDGERGRHLPARDLEVATDRTCSECRARRRMPSPKSAFPSRSLDSTLRSFPLVFSKRTWTPSGWVLTSGFAIVVWVPSQATLSSASGTDAGAALATGEGPTTSTAGAIQPARRSRRPPPNRSPSRSRRGP